MLQISKNRTKHFFSVLTVRNMSMRELLKNMSEGIPISIVVKNDTGIFLLQFYVRGHYVYMKAWDDTINNSLQCKTKENNKFDS